MTKPCPVCGGEDSETDAIFLRAFKHTTDFAESAIRERWQKTGEDVINIDTDWYNALVEGLIAATTEVAFRVVKGDLAAEEEVSEDLREMLASHVEIALDEPTPGSLVQ